MFATPKMVSILTTSQSWDADGTFKVAPQQFYQIYTIHAEKDGYIFTCIYALLTHINEITHNRMLYLDVSSFSQNIFRQMKSLELTTQYMEDPEFEIYMRMLTSLAFVPENEVCDCFTLLMGEFLQSAVELEDYFENNYLGIRLPDRTRRVPPFPMRFGICMNAYE